MLYLDRVVGLLVHAPDERQALLVARHLYFVTPLHLIHPPAWE
jgi:hypothetical protein